ncbi:hypothetical protein KIPB_006567, partial [Kipferlia bialata]
AEDSYSLGYSYSDDGSYSYSVDDLVPTTDRAPPSVKTPFQMPSLALKPSPPQDRRQSSGRRSSISSGTGPMDRPNPFGESPFGKSPHGQRNPPPRRYSLLAQNEMPKMGLNLNSNSGLDLLQPHAPEGIPAFMETSRVGAGARAPDYGSFELPGIPNFPDSARGEAHSPTHKAPPVRKGSRFDVVDPMSLPDMNLLPHMEISCSESVSDTELPPGPAGLNHHVEGTSSSKGLPDIQTHGSDISTSTIVETPTAPAPAPSDDIMGSLGGLLIPQTVFVEDDCSFSDETDDSMDF